MTDNKSHKNPVVLEAYKRLEALDKSIQRDQKEKMELEHFISKLQSLDGDSTGQQEIFEPNKSPNSNVSQWLLSHPFKGMGITEAVLAFLTKFPGSTGVAIGNALIESKLFDDVEDKMLKATVYATLARLLNKQKKVRKIDDRWYPN